MSQIVTGEAVTLDLRVARAGSRSIALLIDLAAQLILVFALVLTFGQLGFVDSAAAQAVILVLYVAVFLGYPVAFETLWRGRTLGKAAMGLRVVRDDGGPVRFRHALIRGLTATLLELPGITFFVAAVVSSLMSERGKRMGDRLAGTVVVQERVPSRAMAMVPMPAPLASWASTLDLSRLSNELALGIRQFFERSTELSPEAREHMGRSLTSAVVASISPPPPPGAPGWAILAAVLAERRRRDEQRYLQQRRATLGATAAMYGAAPPGWGPPVAAPPPAQYYGSAPVPGPMPVTPPPSPPPPPAGGFHLPS